MHGHCYPQRIFLITVKIYNSASITEGAQQCFTNIGLGESLEYKTKN